MTWQNRNPYELLEIEQSASIDEIEKAKKLQLSAWHPDKFPPEYAAEAHDRFKAIREAYDILSDPALRKRLDMSLGVDSAASGTKPTTLQFPKKEQRLPEAWKAMAKWAKDEDRLTPKDRYFAFQVGDQYLEKGRALSDRQLRWALSLWDQAARDGFSPAEYL
ncbi:MAG TPA: DnaJ domain-containing protein [Spirochaetia bacterium]|nr:DnaJ domain-containing protein [Spirochaetia bacterium]